MPADPPDGLDAAADELYAGAREDFTPRRKELAKEARTAGDTTLAASIEKLAKPTTSAWLANQLARDADAEVDEVAELGDAFREAHANLAGADLRSLSQRRTKLVAALVQRAGKLNGAALTEGVTRELEEIFTTAIADAEVARVLIAGRLTSAKDLAAAAAAWPSTDLSAKPTGVVPRRTPKAPRKERTAREDVELERRRAAARQELDDARSAVKEAEADRKEEERILAETQKAADAATERVRRIYEELDAAEAEEKETRRRVGSASRSVKDAERRAGSAWRLVQQAEQKLDELGK